MALLLSRKRCAVHAGRLRHFSAPATGEERSPVPFLLQVSPDRQPNAGHDVLVCAKASARVLRNALPGGLGTMGQDRSTCTPHLVVLITTGSRSVFRREPNIGTSRRYHKRELSSHTSVTSSCCLKTYARKGRSAQKGKVTGSRSVSLPRGVNHTERGFVSKLHSSAYSS
jgi:hypothetical protein